MVGVSLLLLISMGIILGTVVGASENGLAEQPEDLEPSESNADNSDGSGLNGDIIGLLGGDGDDFLVGGAGPDLIFGQDGDDELWADNFFDVKDGGAIDWEDISESSIDTLFGGGGHDIIYASMGDTIYGGPGDDDALIFFAPESDQVARVVDFQPDSDQVYVVLPIDQGEFEGEITGYDQRGFYELDVDYELQVISDGTAVVVAGRPIVEIEHEPTTATLTISFLGHSNQ